ncbi:CatA-like O-acetyltransferase [Aureibacter tunicatorum]|uniref:Chloramphenicol O-acetyltransferase n=1 Tax=Aureibacter tunicatorum TaxID=866807 RepID=A0AAE3XNQ2_9BACT|nr:CatA-like O-acetyltransferase [Aureibacter tunicatorum]MDR6239827.1 chloramphenicol O-acetyltransferase [Aureibacter tunicatorum]BDD04302.1 chloramphenicol acetyltransferase [Aureibacter tunicatorum]
MELSKFLKLYDGHKLEEKDLSSYEKWSLQFFHKKEFVREPNLQITLQLEITKAYNTYKNECDTVIGASFTSYLMWHIIKTTQNHPYFRYRNIDGEWYIFNNLPVFSPIGIGGDARFSEIIVENGSIEDYAAFTNNYRSKVDKSFNMREFEPLDELVWANSHFIGNLPNLQFTGFQLHTPTKNSGRPYFYFGKRYQTNDERFIPLLVMFDHSNLDPFVLSDFMNEFQSRIDENKH